LTDRNSKSPKIRINKVYTRSGDNGKTRLVGGEERFKDDARVEAYGAVDELNAEIGLCRELLKESENKKFDSLLGVLNSIQNDLFDLGTQLATGEGGNSKDLPKLSEDATTKLENEIDIANESLSELESFVLPGGSVINAQFHIARNICRRAERRVISLSKKENVDSNNIRYLNRLSDALFVWSRWISNIIGDEENIWDPDQ